MKRVPTRLDVVVGIGANLGDRAKTIALAVVSLAALPDTEVVATSSVRETAPVGDVPQGPYLNAAVRLQTNLEPQVLMVALLEIERQFGRERRERWGPRTLDLDILWIAGVVMETDTLTLPHPRLHERDFALVPLIEVAKDAVDPRTGTPYWTQVDDKK